jgi:dihydrofolate reductase
MGRPRCSVYIAMSLDGFIARADGGLDWLTPMMEGGDDCGYRAFMGSVDAIVFGRKTYETALGFGAWPYEGKRCVVLTHRPLVARHGEEPCATPLPELVERLGAEGVGRIYVDGGEVVRQFLAAGLVDDLTISIAPVLIGDGIPLFRGGVERWFSLVESRSLATGLVQLVYRGHTAPAS